MTSREKLKDLLINGTSNLLILGCRGLGKSTFITETIVPEMENTIYFQLMGVGGGDAEELKLYLVDECNDHLNLPEEVTPANLKSIIKKHKITLVLDEWEMLTEKDLMAFILELLEQKTRIILIGFHQFAQLVTNKSHLALIEQYFPPNQIFQMPPFTAKEAFELINDSGLVLTDEAKNLLCQETRGHGRYLDMFLIRLRMNYSGETITESHIKDSIDNVKKSIYWGNTRIESLPEMELIPCQKIGL